MEPLLLSGFLALDSTARQRAATWATQFSGLVTATRNKRAQAQQGADDPAARFRSSPGGTAAITVTVHWLCSFCVVLTQRGGAAARSAPAFILALRAGRSNRRAACGRGILFRNALKVPGRNVRARRGDRECGDPVKSKFGPNLNKPPLLDLFRDKLPLSPVRRNQPPVRDGGTHSHHAAESLSL
jgi:hypothetical protein